MRQFLFCFFVGITFFFVCHGMKQSKAETEKKTGSHARRPSPLASPRPTKIPVYSLIFEFEQEKDDGIYVIYLGDKNIREICSNKKKGEKKESEIQKVVVLDNYELGPLIDYIKIRENFFSADEMKKKEEMIATLNKTINYLNSNSTVDLHDTRTFAEKNVIQLSILSFAAGVVAVSSMWLYHLK